MFPARLSTGFASLRGVSIWSLGLCCSVCFRIGGVSDGWQQFISSFSKYCPSVQLLQFAMRLALWLNCRCSAATFAFYLRELLAPVRTRYMQVGRCYENKGAFHALGYSIAFAWLHLVRYQRHFLRVAQMQPVRDTRVFGKACPLLILHPNSTCTCTCTDDAWGDVCGVPSLVETDYAACSGYYRAQHAARVPAHAGR
jgi:hypothetical protein